MPLGTLNVAALRTGVIRNEALPGLQLAPGLYRLALELRDTRNRLLSEAFSDFEVILPQQ